MAKLIWLLLPFLLLTPAWGDDFDSAGVRIHYTVDGQGPPVVLLHGLYSSATINWRVPGTIARLASHYQVIAIDLRGHGKSERPRVYGVEMMEDVVRLLDHLHLPRAQVVGYSLGGIIAVKLMVTHPDRVSSAVLGGMGFMRQGSVVQWQWAHMHGRRDMDRALLHGVADLAVTADQVRAIHVPVTMIEAQNDRVRALYVEPAHRLRPDWPLVIVPDADHITCIVKPAFQDAIVQALRQQAGYHLHGK